jgi:nucleotide-binding universal stress UspA family protein
MLTVNRILLARDFSDVSDQALRYAVDLARRFDATLHLLYAEVLHKDPFGADTAGAGDTLSAQIRERLAQDVDQMPLVKRYPELDTVIDVRRDVAAAPAIMEYAEDEGVDLIVMGTHGRRGVGRFVLGSVAEEVVRQAPCSVMTVRADDTGTPPPTIDRMLVPVDLSEFTVPLHRAALEVAATYSAHIDLLHVIEPLPFPVPLVGAVTIHDLVPDPTERSTEQLTRLVETVRHPDVSVTPHVTEGHAARSIIQQADALGADLIMMASHGLSGIEGFLLGSVTARVARRAHCPVFVARVEPEERPEPPPTADDTTTHS